MKVLLTSTLALSVIVMLGATQPTQAAADSQQGEVILAGHGHGGHHGGGHRGHHGGHHRHHHGHHHGHWGGGSWWGPTYNNWGYSPSCGWAYGRWTCW